LGRILILSSWTAAGHVGLSAAVPVLQALGHEATQLPTVVLSNHPGFAHVAGEPVPAERLAAMVEAIAANGWLDGHAALLTGYLPSAAHVDLACALVARLGKGATRPRIVVDPVLGDEPKGLYVAEAAAVAVRDRLVSLADVLTPNRFELGWLTGRPVATLAEARAAAAALAGGRREVLVTSPPLPGGETGVLAAGPGGAVVWRTPRLAGVPHGTGDAFAAMIAAGLDAGAALGHLQALIAASVGAAHLDIVGAAPAWTAAAPVARTGLAAAEE
jgi:pyridoxine kinase